MLKQARVLIKGDVHGVGFRAWTTIQAKKLGVTGWVRNTHLSNKAVYTEERSDECVEALLQAEESILNQMTQLLKQGPPVSRIDDIDVKWEEPQETFDDFQIIR